MVFPFAKLCFPNRYLLCRIFAQVSVILESFSKNDSAISENEIKEKYWYVVSRYI